jgi:hypothetical protein
MCPTDNTIAQQLNPKDIALFGVYNYFTSLAITL